MMNTISNLCCGCRLCEQICSKNAISMTYDNEGFLYPKIDINLCVNCGLCKKKCPQELLNLKHKKHKVYAAKIKDNEALANSTSGGIFWLIANKVLEQGGIVYGCALQHDYYLQHKHHFHQSFHLNHINFFVRFLLLNILYKYKLYGH